jgi:poly-gamma-glutamate synthesis protein (capsule biosynthesis protein)
MTGRGIDQVLPHPTSPDLYEPCVRDAREYVRLAESAHGPISRPVAFADVCGDALAEMRGPVGPDLRVVNLETSVTAGGEPWPDTGIHYRMHPDNVGCLTAAGIDCCALANNHILDWGVDGLAQTLRTLDTAGVAHAGAGATAAAAAALATIQTPGNVCVLVLSMGSTTSGIPRELAAAHDGPGVCLLPDLSEATVRRMAVGLT